MAMQSKEAVETEGRRCKSGGSFFTSKEKPCLLLESPLPGPL